MSINFTDSWSSSLAPSNAPHKGVPVKKTPSLFLQIATFQTPVDDFSGRYTLTADDNGMGWAIYLYRDLKLLLIWMEKKSNNIHLAQYEYFSSLYFNFLPLFSILSLAHC